MSGRANVGKRVERRRRMTKRMILIAARLFFALLTLFALGYQFAHLAHLGVLDVVNFFSHFTNVSNIFAAVVFIVGAGLIALGNWSPKAIGR
jgi:hypothetical protein